MSPHFQEVHQPECTFRQQHRGDTRLKPFVYLAIGVTALWALSGWLLYTVNDRGTFGDMFGAVNALFSGLAFAGIIFTILLQRKELELQRIELAMTRTEFKNQTLQFIEQNTTLKVDQFEAKFFQVLKTFNSILGSLDFEDETTTMRGRDCFQLFWKRFRAVWDDRDRPRQEHDERMNVQEVFAKFFTEFECEIGHYFRTLSILLALIKRSPITDKQFYVGLVRAQLSSYELLLIFYYGLSDHGRYDLKPFIEEYSLLATLRTNLLVTPSDHVRLYAAGAYSQDVPYPPRAVCEN